jgi:hypothetical protein
MSNKTISINPSLFSVGGFSKTKKKTKKEKQTLAPLISPNVLKNKLLKRIKEHKKKETSHLDNNKNVINVKTDISDINDISTFSDEFNDSINYLQTLSKEKKNNDDKMRYEIQKQKKREELERMTVRNYHSLNKAPSPYVNIELPEELQQPMIHMDTNYVPITISSNKSYDVPYGILKGGLKPTYKDWTRKQRNIEVNDPNASLIITGEMHREKNEREQRLKNIREKIKYKEAMKQNETEDMMSSKNLIQKPHPMPATPHNYSSKDLVNLHTSSSNKTPSIQINNMQNNHNNQAIQPNQNPTSFNKKQIIKKTIKRKYTLGKSQIKKTVAVLLKNRGTRKQVISAQKILKKKPINDVKTYLIDHNLIKIGSNAPNDVIRQLYESSMLAGEVSNINTNILLHNLIKDDKKEL